jgi:hypothetical protein
LLLIESIRALLATSGNVSLLAATYSSTSVSATAAGYEIYPQPQEQRETPLEAWRNNLHHFDFEKYFHLSDFNSNIK